MSRFESPPIGRGEYEATAGAFDHLIGKEWIFEDLDYSVSSARPQRSNRMVTCRLVRNDTGAALLPKRLAAFKTGAGVQFGAVVAGYTRTTAQFGAPIDEFLPAAGVPDGAYFWVVVRGPATVLTPIAGAEFNGDIAEGSVLVALTAATSGATTAGRVAVQNFTASTQTADYSFLTLGISNKIGRALTAKTTGQTAADLVSEVLLF